jgi:hypothetical protein
MCQDHRSGVDGSSSGQASLTNNAKFRLARSARIVSEERTDKLKNNLKLRIKTATHNLQAIIARFFITFKL